MRAATVARKVFTLWSTGHSSIRQCVVKWLFGADNSDAALDAEVQAALMPLPDCVKMVLDCASSPEVAGKNDVALNESAQQILRHLRDSQEQFDKAQKIQRVAKTMHLIAAGQMWIEVHKLPGSKVLQDVPCPALEQFKDKWTPDYIEHVFSDHSSGSCTDVGTSRNPFCDRNQDEMVRYFVFFFACRLCARRSRATWTICTSRAHVLRVWRLPKFARSACSARFRNRCCSCRWPFCAWRRGGKRWRIAVGFTCGCWAFATCTAC